MPVNNNNYRSKDPFYTSPLPRTFYHPSPTREVDVNAVIQGPDKKIALSKESGMEVPFETGSTFHLLSLPQMKDTVQESGDFSRLSEDIERRSNSTLLNSTNLTSSIDEKDIMATVENPSSYAREEGTGQDGSISVLQKYINRFRYSAPKSREEREREKVEKQNTFWWLNSDAMPPNKKVTQQPGASADLQHFPSSKPESGVKLTREAIMALDKDTLDLQQKADKLLSKSQHSLNSSGLCVSTDGLGSSTALSECSYRTDQQPAYRPIFVNLQGDYHRETVLPKEKLQRIEEQPTSPNDVLARWRMRKKMGEAQQYKSTKSSTKPNILKNHSEMDARLNEFRKKLLAQRALVTTEDIQFERQKMKMMIGDDGDDDGKKGTQNVNEQEHPKHESKQSTLPQEDPILSRLRTITSTSEPSHAGTFSTIIDGNDSSLCHELEKNNNFGSLHSELGTKGFNSNNANIPMEDSNSWNNNFHNGHQSILNTNNTALVLGGLENRVNDEFCIDEMTSVTICDAKQKSFSLNHNAKSANDSTKMNHHERSSKGIKEFSENKKTKSVHSDDLSDMNVDLNKENSPPHTPSAFEQGTQYHQRLEAEKPCDDSDRSDKSRKTQHSCVTYNAQSDDDYSSRLGSNFDGYESENSTSSKRSAKSQDHLHSRKKNKHKKDNKTIQNSNDGEMSDASSRKSDRSSARISKSLKNACSQPEHLTSENRNVRRIEEKSVPSKKDEVQQVQRMDSRTALREDQPHVVERVSISPSRSTQHSKVHKAIGETVVDHLFDGPSMISSVDSWASLFPQSPSHSHSFYNSTVITTPTKDISSSNQQHITSTASTPPPAGASHSVSNSPQQIKTITPHNVNQHKSGSSSIMESEAVTPGDDGEHDDSCEEFENDPLMALLLQQKKEYLHKLELIELKLQTMDDGIS